MKTLLVALALAVGFVATLPVSEAKAVPGQCFYSPWGGFCDGLPQADGSFWHCENALGFSNCYQACLDGNGRPFATDYNFNTPC